MHLVEVKQQNRGYRCGYFMFTLLFRHMILYSLLVCICVFLPNRHAMYWCIDVFFSAATLIVRAESSFVFRIILMPFLLRSV